MMKQRRSFTPEQKASILRERFLDKVTVSDLYDKYSLHPNVFYRWQKEMFEKVPVIFQHKNTKPREKRLESKLNTLEGKLAHKDAVIAEIMQDHIQLKKRTSGTLKAGWVPHDTRDKVVNAVRRYSKLTELPAVKNLTHTTYLLERITLFNHTPPTIHYKLSPHPCSSATKKLFFFSSQQFTTHHTLSTPSPFVSFVV